MPFVYDYLLMVFLSATGALQIGAAMSRFFGILILRQYPLLSAVLGGLCIIGAMWWFFLGGELRNLPDTAGGLDGNIQALLFVIGSSGAFAFTISVSSLINHQWARQQNENCKKLGNSGGLEVLEHSTFLIAILSRFNPRKGVRD